MLLSLLQRYISRQETTEISLQKGKQVKKTSVKLISPRYHQLDVVEKLVNTTKQLTQGRSFLIQHSAGSGKSNSIAWLTYRLASLHNDKNKELFQTVFVITDRRVLNRQLQDTICGFDHKIGQIETITDKDNSSKLKDAINDGKRIIITTLHRFPIIYKELDGHSGKNFAIIVDEAHSSQSGKSAEKLKAALADTDEALREMAEWEEKTEAEIKDEMDLMTETLLTQGKHKNLYFYAFTATPKPKTLQTFGEMQPDGTFDAFHHYSMRQAIDEGFIEDVLKYYTTLETSYEIAKAVSENPEYEEPPAARAIRQYHDNHEFVLQQKIAVIVEKFREITLNKIGGKAKAMVVSPSRAHAVRYLFLMREYCQQMGYTDVRPLVAFSGSIEYQGVEYTESQLNATEEYKITESNLPLYFGSDLYNVLIVADKYQTGFDEPLLHTMFVDKGLRGVKAVQTLSRLNRHCSGKNDTYVLDFVNTADSIVESFKPFFEETILSEAVDVNMVYDYKQQLDAFYLWSKSDEDKVYNIYKKQEQGSTDLGKLSSALKPALENFLQLEEEMRFKVRFLMKNFNRFYSYMAQVIRTFDRDLYKSYIFTEFLYKFLPKTPHEKVDLNGKLALINNKLTETFSGSLSLSPTKEEKTINPETGGQGNKIDTKRDLLTNIIDKINIMYQGKFTEADRVIVETIYDRMQQSANKTLKKQAKNSDANMFAENIFPKEFEKIAQKCYMEQMDAFSKLFEDEQFYKRVMQEMAKAMYVNLQQQNAK
jgi:type I restriction enzyme R subunit